MLFLGLFAASSGAFPFALDLVSLSTTPKERDPFEDKAQVS